MALSSHGLRSVQSQAVCQKEAPRHRLKLNVLCNGKSRLVLVARRISDVKAEPLTDTPRTQFAHAFDLTLSGCGHQAPVLRPAPLRAERIEHLRRAAKPIHTILLPNGERRPKECPVTCSRKWRFRRSLPQLASVRSLYGESA
jgi:hypothetical protein